MSKGDGNRGGARLRGPPLTSAISAGEIKLHFILAKKSLKGEFFSIVQILKY